MQNAANFLQAVINQPNPEEMLRANLPMIDDTFMAVLTAKYPASGATTEYSSLWYVEKYLQSRSICFAGGNVTGTTLCK